VQFSQNQTLAAIKEQIADLEAKIAAEEMKLKMLKTEFKIAESQWAQATGTPREGLFVMRLSVLKNQISDLKDTIETYGQVKTGATDLYASQVSSIVGDSLGKFSKLA
jgi:septal ring factor EnvC (AmiA/AmiB activator)